MKEIRRQWGVMFSDGSVDLQFNGRTAEARCRAYRAKVLEDLEPWRRPGQPRDNIRVVSRRVFVGEWEEVDDDQG